MLNPRQAPNALSNTCAGTQRVRTKGLNARIVVVSGNSNLNERTDAKVEGAEGPVSSDCGTGGEKVQLVFIDEQREGMTYGRVLPKVKYGKIE